MLEWLVNLIERDYLIKTIIIQNNKTHILNKQMFINFFMLATSMYNVKNIPLVI